jgi:hypothetical protein
MIKNQIGRRNLSGNQYSYLRTLLALKLEEVLKEKAKETQGKRNDISSIMSKSLDLPTNDTRKELSKIAAVSEGTIQKVKVIQKEATPEQIDKHHPFNRVLVFEALAEVVLVV